MGRGLGLRHLLWMAGAAAVGFLSSYVFAGLLPPVVYHFVYFIVVCGLITLYLACTDVAVPALASTTSRPGLAIRHARWTRADATGRERPTVRGSVRPGLRSRDVLSGRGVIYGTLDGVLLSAFPWLVTWRALGGESSTPARQAAISALALAMGLGVTSAYHLGYQDFRGPKLLQANVGNASTALPTLLSRNPLASPLAHAILHVTAVVHNPHVTSLPASARASLRSPRSDRGGRGCPEGVEGSPSLVASG